MRQNSVTSQGIMLIVILDRYWQPTFHHARKYSFVDAAIAAGYSVLNYDRIGVGSSSKSVTIELSY